MTFFAFPAIPRRSYGSGIFRRRIRLENHGRSVLAGLEDDMHDCMLVLHHQDGCIAAINARWLRQPTHTCGGATERLQGLTGQPLTSSWPAFREYQDPRLHCTHLHMLLGLAAAHALRGGFRRQFDVAVPDLLCGVTEAEVALDGQTVHRWTSDLQTVLAPEPITGASLFSGFTRKATRHFGGDELEAAYVLHMGLFVAGGRMFDGDAMLEQHPDIPHVARELIGTCHARQAEYFDASIPVANHFRDFTDTREEMLGFFPPAIQQSPSLYGTSSVQLIARLDQTGNTPVDK